MSTDNVIQFPGATYEGITCTCGSAWFDGTVCVAVGGGVFGYREPLTCHDCGIALEGNRDE
jgi:hypothetical protein